MKRRARQLLQGRGTQRDLARDCDRGATEACDDVLVGVVGYSVQVCAKASSRSSIGRIARSRKTMWCMGRTCREPRYRSPGLVPRAKWAPAAQARYARAPRTAPGTSGPPAPASRGHRSSPRRCRVAHGSSRPAAHAPAHARGDLGGERVEAGPRRSQAHSFKPQRSDAGRRLRSTCCSRSLRIRSGSGSSPGRPPRTGCTSWRRSADRARSQYRYRPA